MLLEFEVVNQMLNKLKSVVQQPSKKRKVEQTLPFSNKIPVPLPIWRTQKEYIMHLLEKEFAGLTVEYRE